MSGRRTCIVCRNSRVSSFLRIDDVPVFCNQLCYTRTDALSAPTASIQLAFCHDCGHVFNLEADESLLEYSAGYENSLHCSERFREHADALAEALITRYELHGRTVVEIGCGRGEFLRTLCQRGNSRGIGFDPSYTGDRRQSGPGYEIAFRCETYGSRHAGLEVDFVCSRHTLEHISDPRAFLLNIRSAVARIGIPVFFEVPNSLYTLRDGGIWDIIYEHCSYFSPTSLARVFSDSGYCVFEIAEVFGGQFLTIHARTSNVDGAALARSTDLEPLVLSLADSYRRKLQEWRRRLRDFADEHRTVVVWGAGSKGTTFLNTLRPRTVQYVVDVNPRKQGTFVAGTGQEIVGPQFLQQYRPDAIVCMNPNYVEEIALQVSALNLRADVVVAN